MPIVYYLPIDILYLLNPSTDIGQFFQREFFDLQCYSWANHAMGHFPFITNKHEISMGHSLSLDNVNIGNVTIPRVLSTKYLGVILDGKNNRKS